MTMQSHIITTIMLSMRRRVLPCPFDRIHLPGAQHFAELDPGAGAQHGPLVHLAPKASVPATASDHERRRRRRSRQIGTSAAAIRTGMTIEENGGTNDSDAGDRAGGSMAA